MGDRRQLAQDLSQVVWTKFGGSTGAAGQLGEAEFLFHGISPSSFLGLRRV